MPKHFGLLQCVKGALISTCTSADETHVCLLKPPSNAFTQVPSWWWPVALISRLPSTQETAGREGIVCNSLFCTGFLYFAASSLACMPCLRHSRVHRGSLRTFISVCPVPELPMDSNNDNNKASSPHYCNLQGHCSSAGPPPAPDHPCTEAHPGARHHLLQPTGEAYFGG